MSRSLLKIAAGLLFLLPESLKDTAEAQESPKFLFLSLSIVTETSPEPCVQPYPDTIFSRPFRLHLLTVSAALYHLAFHLSPYPYHQHWCLLLDASLRSISSACEQPLREQRHSSRPSACAILPDFASLFTTNSRVTNILSH